MALIAKKAKAFSLAKVNFLLTSSVSIERAKKLLDDAGQFDILQKLGIKPEQEKIRFCQQVCKLDQSTPGGLIDYVERGKRLLKESKDQINPLMNFDVSVPAGVSIEPGSPEMDEYEAIGVK